MKSRQTSSVILALLLAGFVSTGDAQAQNLLNNPGFENQLNGWGTSAGTAVYTADAVNPQSGLYSARGVETDPGSLGRLYQDVTGALTVGDEYRISGWIRTEGVDGCGAQIELAYVDAGGWSIAGSLVINLGNVVGTTDWTYFESGPVVLQPMPAGTVALWFLFDFCAGAGTAWWDDVVLEAVVQPFCGDGNVDPGEQCDDGNNVDGDGCSATCQAEFCGDGVVIPPETCDPQDPQAPANCRPVGDPEECTYCGDGNQEASEECDDGNNDPGDGCEPDCTIPQVPTLGQWGAIILALILLALGVLLAQASKRQQSV